jgi:hypothetical protein
MEFIGNHLSIGLKEKVLEGVVSLAVTLVDSNKTMTTEELIKWINDNYQGFQHPYGDCRGILQASFRRAKFNNDERGMDALVRAFTNVNGLPIWFE